MLETEYGVFDFIVYKEEKSLKEHVALVKDWVGKTPYVRLHSECATGDIFGSEFCDCGVQLKRSLKIIQKEGGVLIYLRQEGRGLGLSNKIQAYELQRQGMDTVEANLSLGRGADERNYSMVIDILNDLKISSLKLMTNNPEKMDFLKSNGFICERVPLRVALTSARGVKYMKTKKDKMGHCV